MERTPILLKMDIRGIPLPGFSEMTDQMPPLRREKILALRDPQDRLRSLAAGLLCREALDRWSLSDLLIRYDPRGKPYVEGAANCFFIPVSLRQLRAVSSLRRAVRGGYSGASGRDRSCFENRLFGR